jgi:hypothetical protein
MSPILMWSQIHCSFPLRKKKISESSSSIRLEISNFSKKEKTAKDEFQHWFLYLRNGYKDNLQKDPVFSY